MFFKIVFKVKSIENVQNFPWLSHKNIPISQMESYFENPLYRLLEQPNLFLLSLKWKLWDKAFSCVKTKTNSNFAVKLVERSNRTFYQPAIACSKLSVETLEQRCELCSKLTIKPAKRRQWRRFGGFIVNFEHISHLSSNVAIVNFEQVNAGWIMSIWWITLFRHLYALIWGSQICRS